MANSVNSSHPTSIQWSFFPLQKKEMIIKTFFYYPNCKIEVTNFKIHRIPKENKSSRRLIWDNTMMGICKFLDMGVSKCSLVDAPVADIDRTGGTKDLFLEKTTFPLPLLLLCLLILLLPVNKSNLCSCKVLLVGALSKDAIICST